MIKKTLLKPFFLVSSLALVTSASLVYSPNSMSVGTCICSVTADTSTIVRAINSLSRSNGRDFDKIDRNITKAAREKKAIDENIITILEAIATGLETTTKASMIAQQSLQDGLITKQHEIQQAGTRTQLKLEQFNNKLAAQEGADTCLAEISATGLADSTKEEKSNKNASIAYHSIQNQGAPGSQEELGRRKAAGLARGQIVDVIDAGKAHSIDKRLDNKIMLSDSIFDQDGDLPVVDEELKLSNGDTIIVKSLSTTDLSEKYATLTLNPAPAPPPPRNLSNNKKMEWTLARDAYNGRISMGNRVFAGVSSWNKRSSILGDKIHDYLTMEDPSMSASEGLVKKALHEEVLVAHQLTISDSLPEQLYISNAQILNWKTNRYINKGWGSSLHAMTETKQLLREMVMLSAEQNYMTEKMLSQMHEMTILMAQQQAMLAKRDLNEALR